MKQMYKIRIVFVSMFLISASPAFTTGLREDVKLAVKVLKGLDNSNGKDWAVDILRHAAEIDSSAYAMNALGMAYMKGIGVEQDDSLTAFWLECAGHAGFIEAYHNLGTFYKNRSQQDFIRSTDSFRKGAEAGSIMCIYDYGFMLYKGIGCKQDYAQAANLFRRGADYDHSPCLYMLGLCYRNGYGVVKDEAKALFYLNRAATLSYRFAMEELNRELPENSWDYLCSDIDFLMEIPATMPDISPLVTEVSLLSGDYKGVLVTYDWSGQNVINERPLTLTANVVGKELSGQWCENGDTVLVKASISEEGRLFFNEGSIKRKERYVEEGLVRYRFESADICVNGDYITGTLRLYSMKEREPERPMYIALCKNSLSDETCVSDKQNKCHIYASPNPFTNNVTINFELAEDVFQAKAHIYSQSGSNVQSFSLGSLAAGKHSVSLHPNIRDGIYVLAVSANHQQLRTIIVKKQ